MKFCKEVEDRMGTIIVVEDVKELGSVIEHYNNIKKEERNFSNNAKFCLDLENIVDEMFNEKSSNEFH